MNKRIVGVFGSEHEASQAIDELKRRGFRSDDISIIARNRDEANTLQVNSDTKAPEGLATGAATGGVLGGVTGLLVGIGALAIPGIGPIIAAGPIAAALAGAAVGAGTGGLVGGLIGLGIPEEEAESYDRYVGEGRILVMVDAEPEQEHDVYAIFRSFNALNASRYGESETGLPAEQRDAEFHNEALRNETGFDGGVDGLGPRADRNRDDASVDSTGDAVSNGSGLEGKHDTGLDTINTTPVHELPDTEDLRYGGRTGNEPVEGSEGLTHSERRDARDMANASESMDSMDTLAHERIVDGSEQLTPEEEEERRREQEISRFRR